MAGVVGFEPRMLVPKTNALPLGYTPMEPVGLERQPSVCKTDILPIELRSL